jgi:hypothetical protein
VKNDLLKKSNLSAFAVNASVVKAATATISDNLISISPRS